MKKKTVLKGKAKNLKKQFKRTLTVKESVIGYKPTPLVAAHWFRKLNTILFGNRLSGCEIILTCLLATVFVAHFKQFINIKSRNMLKWSTKRCPKIP